MPALDHLYLQSSGAASPQERVISHPTLCTALVRFRPADTLEILRQRRELTELRKLLITREQTLGEMRAQLVSFEGRYLRQVGLLYRRLDEWERKIAELHNSRSESADDAADWVTDDALAPQFDPSLLKATYRDLVKLLHPDFASDLEDEQRRTRLMALANEAYARQDLSAIRRMLIGYDPAFDLSSAQTAHDETIRLAAMIFRVTQDLEAVNLQVDELQKSESAKLQQRALDAARQGRDLLAEMAARVNGSIGLAMRRYELDLHRRKYPPRGMRVEDLVTTDIKSR